MCITNPQVLPLERITAFKVMLKVKGGYRPVFNSGRYNDDRIFKVNHKYKCNGPSYKPDRGFHACESLDDAIKVSNKILNWSATAEVRQNPQNIRIVLVELSDNLVFGQDNSVIPPQVRGYSMTILGVWKGRNK